VSNANNSPRAVTESFDRARFLKVLALVKSDMNGEAPEWGATMARLSAHGAQMDDKRSLPAKMYFDGTLTMSRGLGRVERDVLQVFGNNAEHLLHSIEVTLLVACRDTVTESEISSCRRALRTLARQGKIVDLGRNGSRFGRRYYALPDAAADHRRTGYFGKPLPAPKPVLKPMDVEAAILDVVRGGFPWDNDNVAWGYRKHGEPPPQRDEVPYEWLSNSMLKRFSASYSANVRSALSKAVRRLVAKGAIEARGVRLGRNKHLTCRYVRLIEA
jgi:hypothetical protein